MPSANELRLTKGLGEHDGNRKKTLAVVRISNYLTM